MFNNFISVLTLVNTVAFGLLAFYFNNKLEDQKYRISRKIKDFELYTVKRHETYPELYKLILFAHGKIDGLMGLNYSLTFEEYNTDDIKFHLEEKKIPLGKINEIIGMWDEDRVLAIKEVRKYEMLRNFQDARNAYIEATNYLYLNELYMSDEVVDCSRQVLMKINRLYINFEYPDQDTIQENPNLMTEIRNDLYEVKDKMRKELSISYYGKD